MSFLLSKEYRSKISQVIRLYVEIDRKTTELKRETGLDCLEGCGFCCNSVKVEATVLEMLPLAYLLWKIGKGRECLELLRKTDEYSTCVFFKKDENLEWKGRCTAYTYRSIICRLFGFFALKNKEGKASYSVCKIIKENFPEQYKKAIESLDKKPVRFSMTDYSMRIIAIGSEHEAKMMPINKATMLALERIEFELNKNIWFGLSGGLSGQSC